MLSVAALTDTNSITQVLTQYSNRLVGNVYIYLRLALHIELARCGVCRRKNSVVVPEYLILSFGWLAGWLHHMYYPVIAICIWTLVLIGLMLCQLFTHIFYLFARFHLFGVTCT